MGVVVWEGVLEAEGFILDLVIEGVPAPTAGDPESVFPKALREAWRAVELEVPLDDGLDTRRAWRAHDPESDLELTIVWTTAPTAGDDDAEPAEPSSPDAPAPPEESDEPPSFDLGIPPSFDPNDGEDVTSSAREASAADAPAPDAPAPGSELEAAKQPEARPEASTSGTGTGGLLFGHRPRTNARREDLLRVFELGLRLAERLGKRILDPVLGETFEPEDWAYRITEPFRARGFIATHWVRAEVSGGEDWLHTHGMERFGLPDLETFFKPDEEEDGDTVVAYLLELAESWVRDDAPAATAKARRLEGVKVKVLDPVAARAKQTTWTESDLADHDGPRLSILPVLPSWREALDAWRPANIQLRAPGLVDRLCALTGDILPLVRERFAGGADVKLKARFPVRNAPPPVEEADVHHDEAAYESMWIHVDAWDDAAIRGRLANDPERRLDLTCGSSVEVRSSEVWDVLVVQDGEPYRGVKLRRWLRTA